jgi:hypothetical protein
MSTTTIVSGDSVVAVKPPILFEGHRFAWTAVFAGALVTTAVTLFLLALGSGFGLSLVSARSMTQDKAVTFLTLGAIYFFARSMTQDKAVTFLTLGAIYFFAAQAFGFALGGHLAGRLMGPVLENRREEEFLAGAHGFVTWAIAVVASAVLIYLGAVAGGSAALGAGVLSQAQSASGDEQPAATSYWVDRLFRERPEPTHASLGWKDYAQIDPPTGSDAAPGATTEPTEIQPRDTSPPVTTPLQGRVGPPAASPVITMPQRPITTITNAPYDPSLNTVTAPLPRNIIADKAEAGRILTVGMAKGGTLSEIDRVQLSHLVALDTGLTEDAALVRVKSVEGDMRDAQVTTAEVARKTAAYASLWTALALLFGAIVATAAAISARWEDDRVSFGFPTRE